MTDGGRTVLMPRSRVPAGTELNGIYRIDHPIAAGGMGEVYKGSNVQTGDPVAIKMIRSDLAENEAALQLFRREAHALGNLHHEAIVRYYIFAVDPSLSRAYLAMEFVDGISLKDMLVRGPLPFDQVRILQTRLASGLHAAHKVGIIHRDMSPDNVLCPSGSVVDAKILDFGIARSTKAGEQTIIGSGFAGKFNYVSPEQLGMFGGNVTAKSDIYSLGLLLAECLIGRPIDMGGSQLDVIEKRRIIPDLTAIDQRIRPLISEMLSPHPDDRPETMLTVAEWEPGKKAKAKPKPGAVPQQGGSSKMPLIAAGLAGLLALGGGGAYFAGVFGGGGSTSGSQLAQEELAAREALQQRAQAEARAREAEARRQAETSQREQQAQAARTEAEAQARLAREADERRQAEIRQQQELARIAEARRLEDERTRQAQTQREAEQRRQQEQAQLMRQAEDARRRQEAEAAERLRQAEEARRADEARRLAEVRRLEEERKAEEARKAEESRKAEEARRLAEAKRLEDARKAEDARRAEEARRLAEAKRIEDARKAAEAKRLEDERLAAEAKRLEDERKAAELRRQQEAEATRRAEEQRRRDADAARQREEDERKLAEAKRLEEDRKREEARQAEAERLRQQAAADVQKTEAQRRFEAEQAAFRAAEAEKTRIAQDAAQARWDEECRAALARQGITGPCPTNFGAPQQGAAAPEAPPQAAAQSGVSAGAVAGALVAGAAAGALLAPGTPAAAQPQQVAAVDPNAARAPRDPLVTRRSVQGELARLGCYSGALDGKTSPQLDEAIRRFRQKASIGEARRSDDEAFLGDLQARPAPASSCECLRGQTPDKNRCVAPARSQPAPRQEAVRRPPPEPRRQAAPVRPTPAPAARQPAPRQQAAPAPRPAPAAAAPRPAPAAAAPAARPAARPNIGGIGF